MTPELVTAIDLILGDRSHAHVVELTRWRRYRMCFDATPSYFVSATRDPMLTLRALNSLAPDARLVEAG